jgi:hypothetical protein
MKNGALRVIVEPELRAIATISPTGVLCVQPKRHYEGVGLLETKTGNKIESF